MLYLKAVKVAAALGGKVVIRPVLQVVAVRSSPVIQTMKGTPGVRASKP